MEFLRQLVEDPQVINAKTLEQLRDRDPDVKTRWESRHPHLTQKLVNLKQDVKNQEDRWVLFRRKTRMCLVSVYFCCVEYWIVYSKGVIMDNLQSKD